MKISALNNMSFGAILGKKEITKYRGDNSSIVMVLQHIHPFKDEFLSSEDKETIKEELEIRGITENSKQYFTDSYVIRDIVIDEPLPFTKLDYINSAFPKIPAKVNKDVSNFIHSGEISTVIYKTEGHLGQLYYQDRIIEP